MLCLSRKVNEIIDIGDGIHITVIRISGWQVKLGIEAPRDIAIHRREVTQRVNQRKEGE